MPRRKIQTPVVATTPDPIPQAVPPKPKRGALRQPFAENLLPRQPIAMPTLKGRYAPRKPRVAVAPPSSPPVTNDAVLPPVRPPVRPTFAPGVSPAFVRSPSAPGVSSANSPRKIPTALGELAAANPGTPTSPTIKPLPQFVAPIPPAPGRICLRCRNGVRADFDFCTSCRAQIGEAPDKPLTTPELVLLLLEQRANQGAALRNAHAELARLSTIVRDLNVELADIRAQRDHAVSVWVRQRRADGLILEAIRDVTRDAFPVVSPPTRS